MPAWVPDRSVHGGDGLRLAAELGIDPASVIDLSASLCPVAPDPIPVVAAHLDALRRYPETQAATACLADAMGVEKEHLLLTNGGAEAIQLVGAQLGGRVAEPDFSLYPRQGGPLWRSNPNNPLGTLAGPAEEVDVWDEAFYPLATGQWTRGDHLDGAVVIGSLTKLLACPGLRIGYVLCADPHLMNRIRLSQPGWPLNGLAAEALPDLLAPVDLPAWSSATDRLRDDLRQLLTARGFDVRAGGSGPWVLVDHAGPLRARLLERGIVVRDCSSFGMAGTVRIAVPPPDLLHRLAAALDQAIA